MDRRKIIVSFTAFLLAGTGTAAAGNPSTFDQAIVDIENILLEVGSALGVLMIAIESLKWIAAQSPAERESAKKGVIYIMIGLLLLKVSEKLVKFLLKTI
ncbi:MAG: hypothetical protein FJY77_01685 [Candidatus Altiarchaeales archaeon]|nr:hypothetical protein [Candidatus Altiarchaeales archaeon]